MDSRMKLAFWGASWHSFWQAVGSCSAFHPWEPLNPSSQGCCQWVLSLASAPIWDCPEPGAAHCTWTSEHEIAISQLLKFVQVPLNGILFFYYVKCTVQLWVTCKPAACALNLTVYVVDNEIKEHQPKTEPSGTPLVTILP